MSNQILQVDENMLETKLDRLVSRKVEELLNAMPDASGRRDHRGREIRACVRSEGLPCGPLRAEPDREGRDDDAQGAEAEGRGLRVGGRRTLPASRAERRGGAGRHVPGRRRHASGRRRQPPAVGRADALPDALRQAQARVRGHRSMAEPSPWRPIRTRTCSWTACGDRRTWGGSVENVSVLVAIGVDDTGRREVVGVAEGMKEDRASRGSSSGA